MENMNLHTQEAQKNINLDKPKGSTRKHVIIKLEKDKDKDLEAAGEK